MRSIRSSFKEILFESYGFIRMCMPIIIVFIIIAIHETYRFKANTDINTWTFGVLVSTVILFLVYKSNFLNKDSKLEFNSKSLLIAVLCLILITFTIELQKLLGFYVEPKNQIEIDDLISKNPTNLHFLFVDIVLVAPIIEEIVFRGVLYYYFILGYEELLSIKALKKYDKYLLYIFNILFIIASTIMFAYLHLWDTYLEAIPYATMGIVLGTVLVLTKNLLNTIALHMLNNFVSFLNLDNHYDYRLYSIMLIIAIALCGWDMISKYCK
ncbi:CPBP family intramembrane glutamic endopeptidase [Staphylococcus agnetis]|uniref:CPBP family intramembrane glutamic endopeptidase n=1 Tax=Staphylococcus agnetis TaxID=985762 RepID=UPI000D04586A|nr:CPBP family intramembrane glutamic endopeptidase [Staphylococcus agnetis]HDK8139697.1 CPBP family intramembrane metalloprotease [Staphylococcus aureus]